MARVPPLVRLIRSLDLKCYGLQAYRVHIYRYSVLLLTFFFYTSYHMSRKPISVVKGELHRNCSKVSFNLAKNSTDGPKNNTWCDWKPFDGEDYSAKFGGLDYSFLFSYAIAMFGSGYIGERIPLRYFLGFGMIFCGIFTSMFGMGYFWNIHLFSYYIIAQILNGIFQTTGWPGVVSAVGKWFGKGRRGFIMGVWNSHTSVGNILGSVIASAFVQSAWGWSFVVPGIIITCMGVLCLLTLVEDPEDVDCPPPVHQLPSQPHYEPIPTTDQAASPQSKINDHLEAPNTVIIIEKSEDSNQNHETANESKPISILDALRIPGVLEYSFSLFFAKLVSYTFLFWLPLYIQNSSNMSVEKSGLMSTLFDIGGIVGGIGAGLFSDITGQRATTCGLWLILGAGMMYVYNSFGYISPTVSVVLLLITGAFVNGPYALITTAVSADLGTHPRLGENSKAIATVTAIIDGTGSLGAAFGPFLTGFISGSSAGWNNVFYMLIGSNIASLLLLTRLMVKDITTWWERRRMNSRVYVGHDSK